MPGVSTLIPHAWGIHSDSSCMGCYLRYVHFMLFLVIKCIVFVHILLPQNVPKCPSHTMFFLYFSFESESEIPPSQDAYGSVPLIIPGSPTSATEGTGKHLVGTLLDRQTDR